MKITISQENSSPIEIEIPERSNEGFFGSMKENYRFMSLWDQKIYPIGSQLHFWNSRYNADKHKQKDYLEFVDLRKTDKTLTAEARIQWLISNRYTKDAAENVRKEADKERLRKESELPPEVENQLHARIEALANKAVTIAKTLITVAKTDKNIKDYFDRGKRQNSEYSSLNYLSYVEKIPTKDQIITKIKSNINYDLKNAKSINTIKLNYAIYIVDMYAMREDHEDIYDNFGDGNPDIYDIFYNNFPKINVAPFELEFGGYGWESIHAILSEK